MTVGYLSLPIVTISKVGGLVESVRRINCIGRRLPPASAILPDSFDCSLLQ